MLENYFFDRLLLLSLLYNACTTVNCASYASQFYGESSFNDKICIESDRIGQVSTRSQIMCAQMCDETSTCTGVFYSPATMSCTTCRGYTNVVQQTGTLCFTKPNIWNFDGKKFKIFVKEDNRYWHFDGGHPTLKGVTTLYQSNDGFVKFVFEKQVDGSYKIKSVAKPVYMYDGFGVTGSHAPVLNGNDNTDDDHMRYYVSMVSPDYYTIKTKASRRYVRVDEDKNVTSKYNLLDDRSLFKLVEV